MILKHLENLEAMAKTTEKEAYMINLKSDSLLKKVFVKANCPSVNFWIKQIPEIKENKGIISLEEAIDSLERVIEKRQKTGHDARDFLKSLLENLNERDSEVLKRIVLKQLKTSIGTKFLNKLYGKGTIRKFGYMRVSLYKNAIQNIKFDKGGAIVQKKADGVFVNIIIEENGSVSFLTRNGTPFEVKSLPYINNPYSKKIIIHGEGLVRNTNKPNNVEDRQTGNGLINKFVKKEQTLASLDKKIQEAKTEKAKEKLIQKKKDSILEFENIDKNIMFDVWDILDFESWSNGIDKTGYILRLHNLENFLDTEETNRFLLVEYKIVTSLDEAKKFYEKMLNKGEEGAVLKNSYSIWKDTTSTEMVKMKPEKDCDLIITGWYNGEKGSEFELGIGGFNMESSDGLIKVNIGSGLSREQRGFERVCKEDSAKGIQLIHDFDFNQYIGKIAAVKFSYVIKSKGKNTHSLFLPTLIEIREKYDKDTADDFNKIMNQ